MSISVQSSTIDQSGAKAQGDLIAGNKTELTLISAATGSTAISQLHVKLLAEMKTNTRAKETVGALSYYSFKSPADGVVGLEAKLAKADRCEEVLYALEKKELFARFLQRWALYESAQEIFACFLSKIEHGFQFQILPHCQDLDQTALNLLITKQIVEPTIEECGSGAFTLNHAVVMGMVYWLAERCFVRWHK